MSTVNIAGLVTVHDSVAHSYAITSIFASLRLVQDSELENTAFLASPPLGFPPVVG
jgi:hypothetical protein